MIEEQILNIEHTKNYEVTVVGLDYKKYHYLTGRRVVLVQRILRENAISSLDLEDYIYLKKSIHYVNIVEVKEKKEN